MSGKGDERSLDTKAALALARAPEKVGQASMALGLATLQLRNASGSSTVLQVGWGKGLKCIARRTQNAMVGLEVDAWVSRTAPGSKF